MADQRVTHPPALSMAYVAPSMVMPSSALRWIGNDGEVNWLRFVWS